jgi:aldose sugar dehydrogenase
MKRLAIAGLFLALAATQAGAQINAGEQKPEPGLPFNMVQVATLDLPWRIAFLPDGPMLITEKVGGMQLVTQQGAKTPVSNVPAVLSKGQGGMLGVFLSPHYAKDHSVYLTYSEPGEGGSSLALARARLALGQSSFAAAGSYAWASLEGLKVIWRDGERGNGGQFGAQIAFSPGGLATKTLNRITFDAQGGAKPAERWDVGHRIRDVEVGPDGALWMLEDSRTGGLFRVTPKEQ